MHLYSMSKWSEAMVITAECPEFELAVEPQRNDSETAKAAAEPSLWQRIAAFLVQRQQRQLDREMTRLLARSGGQLSDGVEREMMQCLMARHGRFGL
jgi:hypothetical protein